MPSCRTDGGNRVFADMLVGHRDGRVSGERWFAGEHFVENAAQRIDVGSGVDGIVAGLFG